MYYPDELIEEVRMKNDIVDVISGYVRLQKKGGSYFGLCPFHNEKTPSFSVNPARQMYHCFGCGVSGNVITFIMEYENYSFPEALKFLAERAGIELPRQDYSGEARQKADMRSKILEVNKLAAEYYYAQLISKNGKRALEYLRRRQVSDDFIKKFGLGYSGASGNGLCRFLKGRGYSENVMREAGLIGIDERRGAYDRFRDRVMFPIMDANSRVIGFGGRVMGTDGPKYLNSPETMVFNKRYNLYGINRARASRKEYFILCEGYLDVISLHQAGFSNAVASLGTALTPGHALLIKRYARQAYLAYDSDEAGKSAAIRAASILHEADISPRVIDMTPCKDPDEFIKSSGASEFEKRLAASTDGFMFEAQVISKKNDMGSPEGKTAFLKEIAERINSYCKYDVERDNYIEAVSREYNVSHESFKRLVGKMAAAKGRTPPPAELKAGSAAKKDKESGIKTSQKILLTWLSENENLFGKVKEYINPEDFTQGVYRKAAEILFAQLEEGKACPAAVIDCFTSDEEHREAASLFNTKIRRLSNGKEQEQALKEIIVKVKMNSINAKMRSSGSLDMDELQKLADDKRKLTDIDKLHISTD